MPAGAVALGIHASKLLPQGRVLGVQLAGVYRQLHTLLLHFGELLPKLRNLELESEALDVAGGHHRRRKGALSSASTARPMPPIVPAGEARKAVAIIPTPGR